MLSCSNSLHIIQIPYPTGEKPTISAPDHPVFVKDGATESGGQVTESVSTGASEEQDLEVEKHSSKADSKNKEVRPADAAPAIIDKKTDITADFDSLPTSDLVKLKFKKNFEGHGVFEGVVEVSTYTWQSHKLTRN